MKKALKYLETSSLVRNVCVLITSLIIGAVFNIPFGLGAVIDFTTAMFIFVIITELIADVWYKVAKEQYKLCWQYFVGILLVLASDWIFLWASKSQTFPAMYARLALTALFAIWSCIWFQLVYKPLIDKAEKESADQYKQALLDAGVKPDVIDILTGAVSEDPEEISADSEKEKK